MYQFTVDIERMNEIIKNTIEAIEKSRNQIFEIAESAREECLSIERDLEKIKGQAIRVIHEVDTLEVLEKKSRRRLLKVSRDFKEYTEEDIKAAYKEAKDLQIQITLKKQQEQELIRERSNLEIRLRNAYQVVKKAENLVSQVGIAMGYLNGDLKDVSEQLEGIQQKQILGIKIIKVQEEERQRMAREMHDGPAQSMANLVIKAEICEKLIERDTEKAKYELNQLKSIVRACLKDIRKIIYDLRPMSLDDLGLIPTIQRYIIDFREDVEINVDFLVIQDSALHPCINAMIQLTVFRIIQEALNNIRKYAQASSVTVKLEITRQSINVLIADNGIGFTVQEKLTKNKEESGFGLYIMSERVELLKGKINIQSGIGIGTKIRATIPLNDEEGKYDKS